MRVEEEFGLLPCPFCGEEAMLVKKYKGVFAVGCNNSRCRGDWVISKGAKDKNVVIEAWNTRAGGVCAFMDPTDLTDGCSLLKERMEELGMEE